MLIALAVGFTLGCAKELGSTAGKKTAQRLRDIWTDYMRDKVSPPGSVKLGELKDANEG